MANSIAEHFPAADSYTTYIEGFGGGGTMLLSQPIGHVEIYNDIYENVYSLFKVLSNKTMFEEFKNKCDLALYSSQIKAELKTDLKSKLNVVDRAFAFWYVNRTSYNGVGGMNIMKVIRRGMSKSTSDFLSSVDKLKEIHDRLSAVIVLNEDSIKLIKRMDSSNAFIYLDPPYHPSTRSAGDYVHDYTGQDHETLISTVLDLNGKVLISGYDCKEYDRLLSKFTKVKFDVSTLDGNNAVKMKEETLWKNYA